MNRQQKAEVIDTLKRDFSGSQASFVVGFQGLTVAQLLKLRKNLRKSGASFKVAKARLVRLATDGMVGPTMLVPYCREQIGVVFAKNEASSVAKALHDFSKEHESLKLVAGYLDACFLDNTSIVRIASLPSREILLGQVCGTIKAPVTNFVNIFNVLTLRLLWTLKEVANGKK